MSAARTWADEITSQDIHTVCADDRIVYTRWWRDPFGGTGQWETMVLPEGAYYSPLVDVTTTGRDATRERLIAEHGGAA